MKASIAPGAAFAVTGVVAALLAGRDKPLLGIAFGVTIVAALMLNGTRRALASLRIPLSDADDPLSPAAIARVYENTKRGALATVSMMVVIFTGVALLTTAAPTRVFASGFALAAVCAGPLTSFRSRAGLWAAATTTLLLLLWVMLRVGTV